MLELIPLAAGSGSRETWGQRPWPSAWPRRCRACNRVFFSCRSNPNDPSTSSGEAPPFSTSTSNLKVVEAQGQGLRDVQQACELMPAADGGMQPLTARHGKSGEGRRTMLPLEEVRRLHPSTVPRAMDGSVCHKRRREHIPMPPWNGAGNGCFRLDPSLIQKASVWAVLASGLVAPATCHAFATLVPLTCWNAGTTSAQFMG